MVDDDHGHLAGVILAATSVKKLITSATIAVAAQVPSQPPLAHRPVLPLLCVLAAQMTRIIAPAALTTLGLSGAPVHEPVHARGPSAPSSCYCA